MFSGKDLWKSNKKNYLQNVKHRHESMLFSSESEFANHCYQAKISCSGVWIRTKTTEYYFSYLDRGRN